jgi:thiol-disulfide isomerase/thioredoxin
MMFRKRPKPTELKSLDELEPLKETGQPILLEFYQYGCRGCKVMDGIVNELAEEYAGGAHIVKVNVAKVPGAAREFGIRSTPTFILLGRSQKRPSKKARRRAGSAAAEAPPSPRWRISGLVRKDDMARVLESNGAVRAEG